MINNKKSRIEELISNNEFISKILLANNNDDVKQLFKDHEIDVSPEEIEELRANFLEQLSKLGHISDEELKKMSGGLNFSRVGYASESGIGHGSSCGMWAGAAIGAYAGLIDATIKARRGEITDTWGFIKEIFKISAKTSLLGGVMGTGLGIVSGTLHDIGCQGDEELQKTIKSDT